jgi:hypothetical protein
LASREDRLILWLSLNVTISALAASGISFLQLNSRFTYVAVAGLLVAAAALLARRGGPAVKPVGFLLDESSPGAALALGSWLVLLLLLAVRPISEPDSLYNLHFVFEWLENRTTPYYFAYHYVPFWELSYLPALAIVRSDLLYWVQSLKPVLLLGASLAMLARELDLRRQMAAIAIAAGMAFPHLWFQPSGVSTIKNDMIVAAGQAMIALVVVRAVRRGLSSLDWAVLAFALAFIAVKFSGPVLIFAGLLVAIPLAWSKLRLRHAPAGLASLVLWLAAVGHYYFHNLIRFGNPLYPFQLNVLGIRLPGLGDLSNTSIWYSLWDPRVWQTLLLPAGGLSPGGLLFPLTFAAMWLASAAWCGKALRAGSRGRPWLTVPLALSLLQLVVLGVYCRSIYSAGASAGDLVFLTNSLNSLRYIEGAVLVAEVFFVSQLLAAGIPRSLVVAIVVLHGASRLWILGRDWFVLADPGALAADSTRVLAAFAVLAVLLTGACLLSSPRWSRMSRACTVVALLLSGTLLMSIRRSRWLPDWAELYRPFYLTSPHRIYLVVEDRYSEQRCAHLPLKGVRFQNRVETGDSANLTSTLSANREMPPYVVWLRRSTPPPGRPWEAAYRKLADVPAGILYGPADCNRLTPAASPAPSR